MDNYKCILSVGIRCFTEIYLKNLNLKKFSFVFDGALNTNISDIIYLLENKINEEDLIYTELLNNPIVNNLNTKHGYRTIHKKLNYNENNIEQSYHHALFPHHNLNNFKVKQHFERCFDRLDKIKYHKIKTLFCLFIHVNYDKKLNIPFSDIIKLKEYLTKEFNCKLLVCKFEETSHKYKWNCILNNENIIYFHINNNSHYFKDNKIALNEIIKFMKIDESELISYNDMNSL